MRSVGFSESIHGFSDEFLKNKKVCDVAGKNFFNWLELNPNSKDKLCLVAYNGAHFNFPFFVVSCNRYANVSYLYIKN